ncbi:GTP 3',8-cyclase MoaA [Xylophilus sp.]|uniref:GTP 3',8-cyclase MoaA n=1 Tax=Xylophilus sp. TaxID=2653893 RepID=UPI0013B7815C|nr:GTP 3',8-cyclase MoaA [Xylophilus sp.]KAF1047184.1 MAG: GTP 3',8-cyclase [Xylophilus sp.]
MTPPLVPQRRVIPVVDARRAAPRRTSGGVPSAGAVRDLRGRPLTDLRISVTDRCNFRCGYCMPKEVFGKDYPYLPHAALLNFEEIARLARVFLPLGVRKLRLTGGEPLLRRNVELLVAQLAALRRPDGTAPEIALTTNGSLLARKAQVLKDAGLSRVTVSLDAIDEPVFRRMNDVDFPVAAVLDGIAAAQAAGLGPVKVNMVVRRGVNDGQVLPMARHFRGSGVVLRFIEYMDVGSTNGWDLSEVYPSNAVIECISSAYPLVELEPSSAGETARRWGYAGTDGRHDPAAGEIGTIGSVTEAFCGDCSRARLSTEGRLFLCLFASEGHDLRHLLRGGADDAELAAAVAGIWQGRGDRYSELRASLAARAAPAAGQRIEMSYIGG